MSQIRPWQAALFVVALLVLGVSLGWSILGRQRVRNADAVVLVDAHTGDLYRYPVTGRRAVMLPEKNPDTGEYTLLSVYKDDEGNWRLTGGATAALADMQAGGAETPAISDPRGPVSVSGTTIEAVRP